ncbi:MAG: cytochrome C peroxidase [Rhodospirillaceae bacterium]|nr:cytochrome C peroxidase [Rhodospirillaceae bacterium]
MKSLEVKLLSSTVLPILIGGGFVLSGALVAPQAVQAGTPGLGNLNPPAISRAQANLLQRTASSNPCSPCNPCNPCAAKKNPCNPCNPCAAKNPCNPCNPCAAKKNPCNPCGANPCGANVDPRLVVRPKGTMLHKGDTAALVREGKKLFMDDKLSTNDMSCQTCHEGLEAFSKSFANPFPHKVDMAMDTSGISSVSLDEMVQFCMVVPMEAKPLAWDSRELAAITAYTATLQQAYIARGQNPCNPCNPCAAKKNPCNPCNPCAAKKNPCAAN